MEYRGSRTELSYNKQDKDNLKLKGIELKQGR
jgi:hypothetical protein